MTRVLEYLLDLDTIRLGRDAPLLIEWQGHIDAWVLFCLAVSAAGCIALAYRLERSSTPRRVALALLRCLVVALVLAVLCQPALVLQRNRVEPSHVALLIDTSLSMAAREHYRDEELARAAAAGAHLAGTDQLIEHSRLGLTTMALLAGDAQALRTLLARNGVQLYTFAETAQAEVFVAGVDGLSMLTDRLAGLEARGAATDLPGALRYVQEHAQGRRLAAIVLVTDGQSTERIGLDEVLDVARGRQVPILPLRIGSPDKPRILRVGPVRAEQSVFVGDLLAIDVTVRGQGFDEATAVRVTLVDEGNASMDDDDLIVTSKQIEIGSGTSVVSIELTTKPRRTGLVRFRVRVAPVHEASPADADALRDRTDFVDVVVHDQRLRVLYVEGYPRYEYRYLKNALLREPTVELSVLLIEADEDFVQEGTEPIRRFPETPEELDRFDVVLLGDVDPRASWLSQAQMAMLVDFVSTRGGGFGVIAGERFAPRRFVSTPLEKLLPIRIDPDASTRGGGLGVLVAGLVPELTPEGRQSRIFRFAADREKSSAVLSALPELYWIAPTLGAKPGAEVLAEHPTMQVPPDAFSRSTGQRMPIFVLGRYGAGRTYFQATDDTWRWRRHTGEFLHDTYWVRVARELMQPDRVAQDRRLTIRTDKRVYTYGEPGEVRVEVHDAQLLAELGDTVSLIMTDADRAVSGTSAAGPDPFAVARFTATRLSPVSNLFEASHVWPESGRFTIMAYGVHAMAGERPASALIRVEPADLESRNPEADHGLLERIAAATGGRVLGLDEINDAPPGRIGPGDARTEGQSAPKDAGAPSDENVGLGVIRDRSVQIPDDVTEPLWSSKLALLLFGLMISVEWVLRKVFGML